MYTDGRIFLSSEDGEILVAKAGRQFDLLCRQALGEPIMATTAIGGGVFIVRTERSRSQLDMLARTGAVANHFETTRSTSRGEIGLLR